MILHVCHDYMMLQLQSMEGNTCMLVSCMEPTQGKILMQCLKLMSLLFLCTVLKVEYYTSLTLSGFMLVLLEARRGGASDMMLSNNDGNYECRRIE